VVPVHGRSGGSSVGNGERRSSADEKHQENVLSSNFLIIYGKK